MEALVAIIIALLGGLFYFKKQSDKAKTDALIARTLGKDAALKEHQELIESAIAALDAGMAKAKKEREDAARKDKEDSLTLKERADRIKNGLKK